MHLALLYSYITILFKYLGKRFVFAIIIIVASSILSSLGILTLIPLLSLIGFDSNQNLDAISKVFVMVFSMLNIPLNLLSILLFFVMINMLQYITDIAKGVYLFKIQKGFIMSIQACLHKAIVSSKWEFLLGNKSSDYIHILMNERAHTEHLTNHFLILVGNIILSGIYILLALKFSFILTSVTIVCGMLLTFFLRKKVSQVHKVSRKVFEKNRGLFAEVSEYLASIKFTKIYNLEQKQQENFTKMNQDFFVFSEKGNYLRLQRVFLFSSSSALILATLIYFAIEILKLHPSEMIILIVIFARVMPLVSNLQSNYESIVNYLPSFEKICYWQQECEKNSDNVVQKTIEFTKCISFQNVSFQYKDEPIVQDISFSIQKGESIALVGRSGVGKSTLADIFLGLLTPCHGQILIDDDILSGENCKNWRDKIGYVSQDIFLFNNTIRNNLLHVSPASTDVEIYQALEMADAKSFVDKLPQKLDTLLGERGIRLSGGQKQRIVLAQALLRKPQVLVLDEATSALDSTSENNIQEAIEKLYGQLTIVVITHRLSTIANVNKIYVLDKGKIVEHGNCQQLLENRSLFYKMWKTQLQRTKELSDF